MNRALSASRAWMTLAASLSSMLMLLSFQSVAADAPLEVHGHSDSFAANGVVIAWGVMRGTTEDNTMIVLRVAADPARYARIAAEGVDPFTKMRKPVLAERALAGFSDLRIPRAHFADFPRTELRLVATPVAASAAPRATQELVVYYLGVPDTTPEFATGASLDAYLAERVGRLRSTGGNK